MAGKAGNTRKAPARHPEIVRLDDLVGGAGRGERSPGRVFGDLMRVSERKPAPRPTHRPRKRTG